MVPVICPECSILPTTHKCVICKINYVCPECSFKRGYDDLNKIVCQIYSFASQESNNNRLNSTENPTNLNAEIESLASKN